MNQHELQCQESFDAFLANNHSNVKRSWEPGTEPPDFFLTLDGERFAFEISMLAGTVHTAAQGLPEATYYATTDAFRADTEREASDTGILSGHYVLSFDGPLTAGRRGFRDAKTAALSYIRSTRRDHRAPELDLFPAEPGLIMIEKLGVSGANLVSASWNGDARWEGQVVEDAARHLEQKLTAKAAKLSGLAGPKILLADNRLPLAPAVPDVFRSFRISPAHAAAFDGVFVLNPVSQAIDEIHVRRVLRSVLG